MRPGYKTTEFWLTIGLFLADTLQADSMPNWAKAVGVGLYALSRGLAKWGRS